MILPSFHELFPNFFALLTMSFCRMGYNLSTFDLCNQRLDGDGWVCFDNWLDDLCYDLVELAMILSEHRHETNVMTSDTFDNPFVMSL